LNAIAWTTVGRSHSKGAATCCQHVILHFAPIAPSLANMAEIGGPKARIKALVVRFVCAAFGLLAAAIAFFAPVSFIANTLMERESAVQYNGHPSILGAIGGSLLILAVTTLFGVGAYRLLRRAFGHSKLA